MPALLGVVAAAVCCAIWAADARLGVDTGTCCLGCIGCVAGAEAVAVVASALRLAAPLAAVATGGASGECGSALLMPETQAVLPGTLRSAGSADCRAAGGGSCWLRRLSACPAAEGPRLAAVAGCLWPAAVPKLAVPSCSLGTLCGRWMGRAGDLRGVLKTLVDRLLRLLALEQGVLVPVPVY